MDDVLDMFNICMYNKINKVIIVRYIAYQPVRRLWSRNSVGARLGSPLDKLGEIRSPLSNGGSSDGGDHRREIKY